MSRLEKSAKNVASTMGSNILESLLGLVSRTVFIYTLGAEYLGLAGLLGNVLGFLTISELGIATAVGFSLYKPLAEKDFGTISALMSIYRKAYVCIALIVSICGILLFFSLDFFVPPDQQPKGTSFAYFVFLFNTVCGYLLSYKTTLNASDNQTFRIVPINMVMVIIQTVLQVIGLITFKSYILYLIILCGCSISRMIWQNIYITKQYPCVDFYSKEKINSTIKNQLKRNISGLVMAKIGDYLVNSTDNLIITKLVSLGATGIYSNYLLIRNMINGYIATIFSGITASMGNIVAIESDEKKQHTFKTLMFGSFYIYSFEAVCLMCLFNPFIGEIWIGQEYLFDDITVAIIVFNNYLTGLRIPLITMKNAAGKHLEDAWIPFAFAGINLVTSIILGKYLGVAGVFLGTILGSVFTADWYRPIIIYRHVLHIPVVNYYKNYFKYVLLGVGYIGFSYWVCSFINTSNVVLSFVIKAIVAMAIPIGFNYLIFNKTEEFETIRVMYKRLIAKICEKVRINKNGGY